MRPLTRTEADPLLAAVLAAPDDDAPRLVYADWLDEHGQPERAAFIRNQVELARLPTYDPRREVLGRKAGRLLDLHQGEWLAELPTIDGVTWGEFERGFMSSVSVRSVAQFDRAAARIWAAAPVHALELRDAGRIGRTRPYAALRAVRLRQASSARWLEEFLHSPFVSTVRTLDLTGLELENDGVALLARSTALGNLRELILDDNLVGVRGIEALARARFRLTRLSVRGMSGGEAYSDDPAVRSEGVAAIAGSHRFRDLESLDLSGNEIDDEALAALVQSPHLVNLRELVLANNELTDVGLEVLAEEGWEVRLEHLDLSGNPIGDGGPAHLADAEVLGELARLSLERCDLGPHGASDLAGAYWFGGLGALNLNDNNVGADGAAAIAAAGDCLAELRLRNNDLGPDGARHLAGSAALGGLLILDVSGNGFEAGGVRALGQSPHLTKLAVLDLAYSDLPRDAGPAEAAVAALGGRAPTLVWLRLDGNRLGGPGMLGLCQGIEWTELAELALRNCTVNVPALAYLAIDGRFPGLTRLALTGNAVDATGLKAFVQAEFLPRLTHLDLAGNQLGDRGAEILVAADLGRLRWLSVEQNGIGMAGFAALARSPRPGRLSTLRYAGNLAGDWWQIVRDNFPGDETWGDEFLPDGEIPF
jgi:uncharacterized protein (TIGR02996 family)